MYKWYELCKIAIPYIDKFYLDGSKKDLKTSESKSDCHGFS